MSKSSDIVDTWAKSIRNAIVFLLLFNRCDLVVSKVHVSIMNRLGDGENVTLHCQSKDNDLGQQNVADGSEFGWDFSVNTAGTTLFYCDMAWQNVPQYHFDAYDFGRDFVRCETQCLWLVSTEVALLVSNLQSQKHPKTLGTKADVAFQFTHGNQTLRFSLE
ncbi:hypothetical protein CUMW_175810 [Citrus unshiu]|uniref:S-protein homolog n=1 Tax=Citrus unshiu TaxID=55188 RepID=A0A2H5PX89_CITUN|nr:hypothetical protein CUMW_175810 [Citrus unshiu]